MSVRKRRAGPRLVSADVVEHRPDERRSDTLRLELRVYLRMLHRDEARLPVIVGEPASSVPIRASYLCRSGSFRTPTFAHDVYLPR